MKSIGSILCIKDDAKFATEIILFINDKQIAHGFESLTEIEKIVLLANDCEYRIARGGLTDVLLNPGRDWRDAMIGALSTVGATRTARILRDGADLFDAVPAAQAERAATIDEEIALAGDEKLEALDRALGDEGASEIAGCLHKYVVAHRTRFRAD